MQFWGAGCSLWGSFGVFSCSRVTQRCRMIPPRVMRILGCCQHPELTPFPPPPPPTLLELERGRGSQLRLGVRRPFPPAPAPFLCRLRFPFGVHLRHLRRPVLLQPLPRHPPGHPVCGGRGQGGGTAPRTWENTGQMRQNTCDGDVGSPHRDPVPSPRRCLKWTV